MHRESTKASSSGSPVPPQAEAGAGCTSSHQEPCCSSCGLAAQAPHAADGPGHLQVHVPNVTLEFTHCRREVRDIRDIRIM